MRYDFFAHRDYAVVEAGLAPAPWAEHMQVAYTHQEPS